MTKKVIWSPASEKDLENILDYLKSTWNIQIVSKFINKVDDSLILISWNPALFPIISETLNIRKCVVTKHNTLYYREQENKIEIIRLFDTRQDPKKLKF